MSVGVEHVEREKSCMQSKKEKIEKYLHNSVKILVVVYNWFFCRNLSWNNTPTWHHFVCSLKKEDMGYWRTLFRSEGESVVGWKRGGENDITLLQDRFPQKNNCILLYSLLCWKLRLVATSFFKIAIYISHFN